MTAPAEAFSNVQSQDTSALTLESGTTVSGNAESFDASTLNLFGADVDFNAEAFGNSVLNMTGGEVGFNGESNDSATFNISGGMLGANATARNTSIFNLSAGDVGSNAEARDSSTFNMTGGAVGSIAQVRDSSAFNFFDGTVDDIEAREAGVFNMSGGLAEDEASIRDMAVFNLSGGEITNGVRLSGDADLFLFANDFGEEFMLGEEFSLADLGPDPQGNTALKGVTFELTHADLSVTTLDVRAAASPGASWSGTIHLVPEPDCAALAIAAGTLGMLARRRSSRPHGHPRRYGS